MANVKFLSVKLRETFDALKTKDSLALYWIDETQELYKGDKLFGTGTLATKDAAGLLSPEDYVKLQELVSSGGGLSGLAAVDGTIVIADGEDGGKTIGVGLSAVEGNMLIVKNDGLYVGATKVPEYSIEKQETAEDGFISTYRLKKTVDGESTYVGDSINIFKDLMISKGSMEIASANGVPYESAVVGDPYIDLVLNDADESHIYIPVKGLIDTYTAGDGIVIENNVVKVKVAENSHGLVAVDGALSINLATRKSDGAMSKEDKLVVDSIPYAYVARKFEVSDMPVGTLVSYGEREIRIMCPANVEFKKQNVGTGGDANTYYMTLKTYAPSGNVTGYIEHIGTQADSEILTNFSTDEYGRRYQSTWLGLAKLDETSGVWSYYGKNSSVEKFIGWDYQIDWYDADGVLVASDPIRINLSNEECHNSLRPYYGPENDFIADIAELKGDVAALEESYTWTDM